LHKKALAKKKEKALWREHEGLLKTLLLTLLLSFLDMKLNKIEKNFDVKSRV